MAENKKKTAFLFLIFFVIFICGCSGKESVDLSEEKNVQSSKEIVWLVYSEEYAEIWQEPLNELLKSKKIPYTVNIQVYFNPMDIENLTAIEQLRNWENNNQQADVISVFPTSSLDGSGNNNYTYRNAASEGLLLSLEEYLKKPEGAELKKEIHQKDLYRTKINGVTYGITQTTPWVFGTGYNKEYVDKYKMNIKDLPGDVFNHKDILVNIQVNEEGKVIPYLAESNAMDMLFMWKVDSSEVLMYNAEGDFVNAFATKELKTYLQQLQELKKQDLVEFSDRVIDGSEFFSVATVARSGDAFEDIYVSVDEEKRTEIYTDIIVIPDINKPYTWLNDGDAFTGIASWTQNEQEALDFLNLLYTDQDIANLITYGVKDEGYTVEDGHGVYDKENGLSIFAQNYTNPLLAYPQKNMSDNPKQFLNEYYEKCETHIPTGFRFDPTPVQEEIAATNDVIYNEYYELRKEVDDLFHLEVEDIDKSLEEINSKLTDAGIDKIIEEAKRQLEEWKKGS